VTRMLAVAACCLGVPIVLFEKPRLPWDEGSRGLTFGAFIVFGKPTNLWREKTPTAYRQLGFYQRRMFRMPGRAMGYEALHGRLPRLW
jgi:hypothetical protein